MKRDRHQEGREACDRMVAQDGLNSARMSFERCSNEPNDLYDRGFAGRLFELEKEQELKNEKMMLDVPMGNVDWTALREQKQSLLEVIHNAPGLHRDLIKNLDGILHLLDHIQDEAAAKLGEEVVFGVVTV